MKKEIIGYKLTKPEYEQAAVLICKEKNKNTSIEDFKIQKNGTSFLVPTRAYDWLKEAGVLDLWFEPVYKEEFKIVPDKWYLTKMGSIYCCKEVKEGIIWTGKEIWGYGIDSNSFWIDYTNLCFEFDIVREATKEEVEKALINEAKKRYSIGGRFASVMRPNDIYTFGSYFSFSSHFEPYEHPTALFNDRSCIFKDGKWAEIVKDESEYKVSDYVVVQGNTKDIHTGNGITGTCISKLYSLGDPDLPRYSGNLEKNSHFVIKQESMYFSTNKKWILRKATEEEINKITAPKFKFGGREVTIYKGYIEANGEKFNNNEIERLEEFLFEDFELKGYSVTIKSFQIGCSSGPIGTLEEFRKIYDNLIW
jgi:hypothetical protein